jgi:hypothetical protein
MKHRHVHTLGIILILLLSACGGTKTPAPEPTRPPEIEATEPPEITPTETESVAPTEEPTEEPIEEPTEESEPVGYQWLVPITKEDEFARSPVTSEEQETFDSLANLDFNQKDPLALAVELRGVLGPIDPIVATEAPTLEVGVNQDFWILNQDTLEWGEVTCRLERVTDHAYLWFDVTRPLKETEKMDRAAEAFEVIYGKGTTFFGSEANPGIDGDPHTYILHVAGTAICNVTEETSHQCGILGYFASTHALPTSVEPHSNQHEMFVMNIDRGVGGPGYESTLVHEFRHMIEDNYGRNDDGWSVEGTAVFAQHLIGDWLDPSLRGSEFTNNTDIQLNAWTKGNTIPHYGKGYLFVRYIYERIGDEAFRAWTQYPGRAFFALDAILDEFGFEFNALDLWLDWTVSISLIGYNQIPEVYGFGDDPFGIGDLFEVEQTSKNTVNKFPRDFEEDVRQYAFDIYDVRGSQTTRVDFVGSTKTAVLNNVVPPSGQHMWYSGRSNESAMTLTREVDLGGVDSATLNYSVFYRIENEWDFAHVLVSTDGGQTWENLVTENMGSKDGGNDPGDLSATDYFYTGMGREWIEESIDLSVYAGQKIYLRFMYITDLAYTDPGMLVDNISIPEIGFYDDVENIDQGWEAEGFTRVTAYVPQRFHLIMINFDADGVPVVEILEISDDNTASFEILLTEESRRAHLIVAASNPLIMTPGFYQLSFNQ